MPAIKKAKAAAGQEQMVTRIKLSAAARSKVLKDLAIDAPIGAVPETIQVVRMSRKDFPSKVASPAAWVLVMV